MSSLVEQGIMLNNDYAATSQSREYQRWPLSGRLEAIYLDWNGTSRRVNRLIKQYCAR